MRELKQVFFIKQMGMLESINAMHVWIRVPECLCHLAELFSVRGPFRESIKLAGLTETGTHSLLRPDAILERY